MVLKILQDHKIGILKMGVALQHCDTRSIRTVPSLLLQQYHSFKINMERSAKFVDDALAAAAQTTAIERQLFKKLGITLKFNFL